MKFPFFKKKEEDYRISSPYFEELRRTEYFRLDNLDQVYLDYTGSNIYPQTLVDAQYNLLSENVFGNPNSLNICSRHSLDLIEEARSAVKNFFMANDYDCIFTDNATGGLKIISNFYPFSDDSVFLLTVDNHNSVNGIREKCRMKGGTYEYIKMSLPDMNIDNEDFIAKLHKFKEKKNKLFAYPAQSNITGAKHNLNKISMAQKNGWDVLLDAAAFVPTSKLSLKKIKPDFVCVSFYKMFGLPTGLGALLVRKDKLDSFEKNYFSGDSTRFVSIRNPEFHLEDGIEKFEDGTLNFLSIPIITQGLEFIEKIGMERIQVRMEKLSVWFMEKLQHLYHDNGQPMIKLLGPSNVSKRGASFLMNFYDKNGSQYPHEFVAFKAKKHSISLRTGSFCNPGIDEVFSDDGEVDIQKYYSTINNEISFETMQKQMGKGSGALRVSFGIPTVQKDLDRFFVFVKRFQNKAYDPENKNFKDSPIHSVST